MTFCNKRESRINWWLAKALSVFQLLEKMSLKVDQKKRISWVHFDILQIVPNWVK